MIAVVLLWLHSDDVVLEILLKWIVLLNIKAERANQFGTIRKIRTILRVNTEIFERKFEIDLTLTIFFPIVSEEFVQK